jgi:hypothetical protein
MSCAIGCLLRSRTVFCCPAVRRAIRVADRPRGRLTPTARLKAENLLDQTRNPYESFGEFLGTRVESGIAEVTLTPALQHSKLSA